MDLFVTIAMSLDTLPSEGRMILLAYLLTLALYGFSRRLPEDNTSALHVLYGKGALSALLIVPLLIYLLGVQLPVLVPLSEYRRYDTDVPALVVAGILVVWLMGAVWHLVRLYRASRSVLGRAALGDALPAKLAGRAEHWCRRLNVTAEVDVVCGGAELGWHARGGSVHVHLPAAAMNWPMGIVDVMLLQQLAQVKQNSWRWLLFGRFVQAIYWPAPWVTRLVDDLANASVLPAARLARAAYRDPEGWARDERNYLKRIDTLEGLVLADRYGLRLPSVMHPVVVPASRSRTAPRVEDASVPAATIANEVTHEADNAPAEAPSPASALASEVAIDDATMARMWAGTKARHRERQRDPYEQVYWLIAAASLAVGISTTLTLVPASPEFEPKFLNVRWQDQMSRRLFDTGTPAAPPVRGVPRGQRTDNPAADGEAGPER